MENIILNPEIEGDSEERNSHFEITNDRIQKFNGVSGHREILNILLDEITKVDFIDYLGLPSQLELMQKHQIVGVVKKLISVATDKRWNISIVNNYIFLYNGAYWQQIDKEEMKSFLGKAAIKMGIPEYNALHFDFKEKLSKQFFSDAHLPSPLPTENKTIINLSNCTYEFDNYGGRTKAHNPEDFLTYQLKFNYDENAKCPLFDAYLLKVLPDLSSRLVLQEFSGYIFTPLQLEKILVLYGSGRNGKSVYFNVIQALIGIDNILTYSLDKFNHEYNRAKLFNALLNYSSEKGSELNIEIFKALISGEPQQAREPHGKSFTIRNKVRFIMNANGLPKETEQTSAYFERYLILPFETYIKKEDRDSTLADKIIRNELSGVFNWLLAGVKRILLQGHFTECEKANDALSEFKKQSDNVALFLEDKNYIPSKTLKISVESLYIEYRKFCHDDGYRPLGKNNFTSRLRAKEFEATRLSGGRSAFFIEEKNII